MAQLRCCLAVSIILALGWVIEGDSMAMNTAPVASFGLQADDDEAWDNDYDLNTLENSRFENKVEPVINADENAAKQFLNVLADEIDGEHSGPHYGDNRYPLRVLKNTHGSVYTTRNTPRQGESCFYPFRGAKPLYCSYYVTFGNHTKGDKLISNETYKKKRSKSKTPFVVRVNFPKKGNDNQYTITYVYVADSERSERIYEDDLAISKGGIGDTFIKLRLGSDYADPDSYKVAIYGKLSE